MALAPRPAKLSEASRAWADSLGSRFQASTMVPSCSPARSSRGSQSRLVRPRASSIGASGSVEERTLTRRVTVMKAAGKLALGSRSGIAGTSGSRAWPTVTICSPWRR